MTATNHVVTGALIAASITNPWFCLPLALLSHVVLDMLPHFGVNTKELKGFIPVLITDIILASIILLTLLITRPSGYILIVAGAITASSPDLLSIPYFISLLKHRKHQFGIVQRFLSRIQWSETVLPGLAIEMAWFSVLGTILLQKLT